MSIENPTSNPPELYPSTLTRKTVEAGESGITTLFNKVPMEMRKDVADALVEFLHRLADHQPRQHESPEAVENTKALIEKLNSF